MALNWFKKTSPKDKTDFPDHKAAQDVRPSPSETQAQKAAEKKAPDPKSSKGFFNRLRKGLSKTRSILTTDIDELFSSRRKLDDAFLEELEERFITADLGVATTMQLIDAISAKSVNIDDAEALKQFIKERIWQIIDAPGSATSATFGHKPHIVMVVGVNGVGKTTTIAKLAHIFRQKGRSVLISAADTFRAAAVEQLAVWAQRAGADIVRHKENADPAAVVFDSIEAACSREMDMVYIDTAGRLHTKVNLMEEIKKIKRTVAKKIPGAPHEILLVLDATTGQNALSQAKLFNEALDITGLVLTKLDGTAKGGIVVSICSELKIPLKYIGVGESLDDLQEFDARQFVDALF